MQKKNMIKNRVQSVVFYIGIIILWQFIYFIGVHVLGTWKSYVFPSPYGVIQSLYTLILSGNLFIAILFSLKRVLFGYLIALAIGGAAGIWIANVSYLNRNVKPLLLGIQSLPSICWVPFAILWFGLDEASILFVIVIGSVGSVALAIEDAFGKISPIYLKAARTMGATEKSILFHVILPAALPSIVAGIKQSWSFAWRALMSGEVLSSCIGLGYTLMMGRDLADINQVMAVMIVIIIIGILIDKLVFTKILRNLLQKRGLYQY